MSSARTYLDHNASSPLRPEARAAMIAALDLAGNPSSVHGEGRRARAVIEAAREEVAALVGAKPAEVVFTSGGTEANAAIIAAGWEAIAVAPVEHDSVLAPVQASGARVIPLAVTRDGVIDIAAAAACPRLEDAIAGRTLVAVQTANNETGVRQPVAAIAEILRPRGLAVLTDAVQIAGREPIDFSALGIDYLTLSAHKLGGPKGVGAIVARDGTRFRPLITGGGQERRRRAGTENVAGIAGFGAAAAAARRDLGATCRLRALRDRLEREALVIAPAARVIAATADRLDNTTSLALPGAAAETLVIRLDLAGIAVSAGAACSSGKVGVSHVLAAMHVDPALARGAIRISLGWSTTEADVDAFLAAWRTIAGSERQRAVA